jgi:hypothetical protein
VGARERTAFDAAFGGPNRHPNQGKVVASGSLT